MRKNQEVANIYITYPFTRYIDFFICWSVNVVDIWSKKHQCEWFYVMSCSLCGGVYVISYCIFYLLQFFFIYDNIRCIFLPFLSKIWFWNNSTCQRRLWIVGSNVNNYTKFPNWIPDYECFLSIIQITNSSTNLNIIPNLPTLP